MGHLTLIFKVDYGYSISIEIIQFILCRVFNACSDRIGARDIKIFDSYITLRTDKAMSTYPQPRCDCCGLLVNPQSGPDCPRCGYPIQPQKELIYLGTSIRDLRRVADYGGSSLTVGQLIARYQTRHRALGDFLARPQAASVGTGAVQASPVGRPDTQVLAQQMQAAIRPVDAQAAPAQHIQPTDRPMGNLPPARPAFSFGAFLAENYITLIGVLAGFLILIGMLAAVAADTTLQNSFLIVFAAHAGFAAVGVLGFRFQNFRMVGRIYTAISALLLPLVAFSAYRLVVGQVIHISPSALVAASAAYATLAYGALAVYQRFKPFGYLAAIALLVTDLAVVNAWNLAFWWWPVTLLVLAFPLPFLLRRRWPWDMETALATPMRELLFTSVALASVGLCLDALWAVISNAYSPSTAEPRIATAITSLGLLLWFALYAYLQRSTNWAKVTPYLLVLTAYLGTFAFYADQIVYVLVTAIIVCFYHLGERIGWQPETDVRTTMTSVLSVCKALKNHFGMLVLGLGLVLPWIVDRQLPYQIMQQTLAPGSVRLALSGNMAISLVALLVTGGLFVSMGLLHTEGLRVPRNYQQRWCWILLPAGLIFAWAFALFALTMPGALTWWLLGLALACVLLAVVTRFRVSAAWANPQDALALLTAALALITGIKLQPDYQIGQVFFVMALTYGVALLQRRPFLLLLPAFIAFYALPVLVQRTDILFVAALVLPFVAVFAHRLPAIVKIIHRAPPSQPVAQTGQPAPAPVSTSYKPWAWPALGIGLLFGLVFAFKPGNGTSLLAAYPLGLELAALAVVWYVAAALSRAKWWLSGVLLFGVIALAHPYDIVNALAWKLGARVQPVDTFYVLVWLAPVLVLGSLAVQCVTTVFSATGGPLSRIRSNLRTKQSVWAMPFTVLAIVAALVMGLIEAPIFNHVALAAWALLSFAALIYVVGVLQRNSFWLWLTPFFATLALYYASFDDLYRPPVIALACAALGIAVRFAIPIYRERRANPLFYTLPLYVTALAGAILTGLAGWLLGINKPFYAAVPDALLHFALAAYVVLLSERLPRWQLLVLGFAVWAVLLAVQASFYYVVGIGLGLVVVGLACGMLFRPTVPAIWRGIAPNTLTWNWSWYGSALSAALLVGTWNNLGYIQQVEPRIALGFLLAFAVLAFAIMLLVRMPALLLVPMGLLAFAPNILHLSFWQMMLAFSAGCVLLYASRLVWRVIAPFTGLEGQVWLHAFLALGGQVVIVISLALNGGFAMGMPGHTGAIAALVLAGLMAWAGAGFRSVTDRRNSFYFAGLLLSLALAWEFRALGIERFDLLVIAPATYLIVIAPFLLRDRLNRTAQVAALVGSILLLLPALWLSFGNDNLGPTALLAGEALILFIFGMLVRMRTFFLSGAALVVVSAIHAVFLPSLAIPPSLALTIIGGILLALATGLSLARHRLRVVWTDWQ
jgi:hypothetical protein